MDKRIFVEKKADFQVKSESLVRELQHNLGLSTLKSIRIVQVYDVFDLAEDLFAPAEKHIFSCLLYTSPSPRDQRGSRMPSSA